MYDSGGISLKPSDESHAQMKNDMTGAAAILGAMTALRALGCSAAVTAYLCCTDNMPSGSAMKLGDVLRMRNGTTVEVLNTDAEGRLVMADGLCLAVEDGVDAVVDIATLTGACLRTFGVDIAGVMGNDRGPGRAAPRGGRGRRRAGLGAAAAPALPRPARLADRRPHQHGRHQRRLHHRGALPRGVRGRAPRGPTSTSPVRPSSRPCGRGATRGRAGSARSC